MSTKAKPYEVRNEDDFRRYVAECAADCHVSHIESHLTSAGIPDLNICMRGTELWLELKVMSSRKPPKMRATQKKWHVDRFEHGGISWVVTLDLDMMDVLILPGNVAAGLPSNPGIWRAAAMIHPFMDMPKLLRSLARRAKNA